MEITAAIVLFFVLTILVVAFRKKKVDSNTLQDWANIVTISSVISAIVVGIIVGVWYLLSSTPPPIVTPTPSSNTIILPDPTSTTDPCKEFVTRVYKGAKVQAANVLDENLNVRKLPSLSAPRITSVQNGTEFQILNGPICADGLMWWEASTTTGSAKGWIAEVTLRGTYYIEPK